MTHGQSITWHDSERSEQPIRRGVFLAYETADRAMVRIITDGQKVRVVPRYVIREVKHT